MHHLNLTRRLVGVHLGYMVLVSGPQNGQWQCGDVACWETVCYADWLIRVTRALDTTTGNARSGRRKSSMALPQFRKAYREMQYRDMKKNKKKKKTETETETEPILRLGSTTVARVII